jgi:hypothetical protein
MSTEEGVTVEPCVVHHFEDGTLRPYEEDCDMCINEHKQRMAALQALVEQNNNTMQSLAANGFNDPMLPVALRIDALVQFLFMGNGRMSQQFEVHFHSRVADVLKDVQAQMARARLTQGVGAMPINNITQLKRK